MDSSTILKPARVISSEVIDQIAKLILEYDLSDKIQIPSRLHGDTTYERGLATNYRTEDINGIRAILLAKAMTPDELFVLDALLRWNFRNSGGLMRSAYGLLGAAVSDLMPSVTQGQTIAESVVKDNMTMSFVRESMMAIRRMVRMTVAMGAHECKIPRNELSVEYESLIDMSRMFGTDGYDVESSKIRTILAELRSNTPIDQTQDRTDLARKLCLQMVIAISEYRRDDTFGRLRGFMNNVCHFANFVRVMSSDNNPELNRLAQDLLDQAHSTDRLLNSNCITALGLIKNMNNGDVVYDRILELGKHQHRVMALEVASCIGLFSYLVKSAAYMVQDDSDVRKTLSRLLNFSGVATRYTKEVANKSASK